MNNYHHHHHHHPKRFPAVIYITTSITTCAVNGSVMRLFFSLPNTPVPACLSLPLCSGTLWMWWHRWQQLAELVPSVNGVQQLYPAAMNIRAERGMEWPAPDINKGITKIAVQPLLPVSLGTRLCSSLPESKYSGTCMLNYLWTQSVTTLY